MNKIAVLTSGGDSPGMNACIRSVVRTCIYHDKKVVGIMRGYDGMIDGDFKNMESTDVSGIIHRGGTILRTARCMRFFDAAWRKVAYSKLLEHEIDGVVVIGGDGTFSGATVFQNEYNIPFVGVPGTIDNDLFGTDDTLGFDTAVNTAVEAIDKIRDTAASHDRLFFVEAMGRDAGFIALSCGIAGGAEAILIPESETDIDYLINILEHGWHRKKTSAIVIVAEGSVKGDAFEIAKLVKEKFTNYDTRVSVLGHMQRGGNPTVKDRILGSRLGMYAVEALLEGRKNEMIGIINDKVAYTPFDKATKHHADIDKRMLKLIEILAI